MGRVHRERSQHREDSLGEELVHPILLHAGQFVPAQDLNALLDQLGPDLFGEDSGVLGDQFPGPVEDGQVHVARHHPADRRHGNAGGDPTFEPGDSTI